MNLAIMCVQYSSIVHILLLDCLPFSSRSKFYTANGTGLLVLMSISMVPEGSTDNDSPLDSSTRSVTCRWSSFTWFRILRSRVTLKLCHRFLTWFSDRPGIRWDICVHLFPSRPCSRNKISSSSRVQAHFFKVGSKTLQKRSEMCSARRPGRILAIWLHFHPCCWYLSIQSSSSGVQAVRLTPGLSALVHRLLHCKEVLALSKYFEAILFQLILLCLPSISTACLRRSSSSADHR